LYVDDGPGIRSDTERERELRRKIHQSILAVTRDLEAFQFNTVISSLMELTNAMVSAKAEGLGGTTAYTEGEEILLKLLAPVAPHLAEELWQRQGRAYSIHTQAWPIADEEAAAEDEITLVVQVNGKVRDKISAPADIDEAAARTRALASEAVQRHLEGREPRKVIFVPGRLVNLVA
jgi:leucyl-tRNA synthetase